MLIFKDDISKERINLYFDLDIDILKNIDCLIDDIEKEKLCVVDTFWKNSQSYFENVELKNLKSFVEYGNTSVMGWIGKSQNYLFEYFYNDIFKHTIEHFGDDTFINRNANKKYFKPVIVLSEAYLIKESIRKSSIIQINKKIF